MAEIRITNHDHHNNTSYIIPIMIITMPRTTVTWLINDFDKILRDSFQTGVVHFVPTQPWTVGGEKIHKRWSALSPADDQRWSALSPALPYFIVKVITFQEKLRRCGSSQTERFSASGWKTLKPFLPKRMCFYTVWKGGGDPCVKIYVANILTQWGYE